MRPSHHAHTGIYQGYVRVIRCCEWLTEEVRCSRWRKAKHIMSRPEFAAMRKVKLSGSVKSCYWRFNTESDMSEAGTLPAPLCMW